MIRQTFAHKDTPLTFGNGDDVAKVDQILTLTPKALTLGAIYKKISVPKLMSYQTGNVGQLMSWLANELIERIDNEQRVILVGDGRATGATGKKLLRLKLSERKRKLMLIPFTLKKQTLCAHWQMFVLWLNQMDDSKPITMYAHPAVITGLQSFQ